MRSYRHASFAVHADPRPLWQRFDALMQESPQGFPVEQTRVQPARGVQVGAVFGADAGGGSRTFGLGGGSGSASAGTTAAAGCAVARGRGGGTDSAPMHISTKASAIASPTPANDMHDSDVPASVHPTRRPVLAMSAPDASRRYHAEAA